MLRPSYNTIITGAQGSPAWTALISSLKSINRRCYRVAIRGRTPQGHRGELVAGRNPALSHLVSRTGLGLAKALSPHAEALFILQLFHLVAPVMSHKGKNSAAKGKKPAKSGAESKGEDVLQAVVRGMAGLMQMMAQVRG